MAWRTPGIPVVRLSPPERAWGVVESKGLPAPPVPVLEARLGDRPRAADLRTRSGPEGSSRSGLVSGRVSGLLAIAVQARVPPGRPFQTMKAVGGTLQP